MKGEREMTRTFLLAASLFTLGLIPTMAEAQVVIRTPSVGVRIGGPSYPYGVGTPYRYGAYNSIYAPYRSGISIGIYPTYPSYGPLYTPMYPPRYYGFNDYRYLEPTYYPPPSPLPATPEFRPQPTPITTANVRVLVPTADARVWFDGHATTSTGTERVYHTPALKYDSATYRVRAQWTEKGQEMIQEQVVTVNPGQTSVVDFTRPVVEPVPEPSLKR